MHSIMDDGKIDGDRPVGLHDRVASA